MSTPRVLLITRECLRSDSNEGNVLINLFSGLPVELANIYCKPGLPDVPLCSAYFQLTDRMALENLLRKTPMGRTVQPETAQAPALQKAERENRRFYDFFRRYNFTLFHMSRELLWKLADFKSDALDRFVLDFAPDVVFAPQCYSKFVLAVQRYVIGLCKAPAVTYLYDDLYSLKQLRVSPLYWLDRLIQRRSIRKTLDYYRFAYTMTQQQADEYAKMLPIPMKVLRKCAAPPAQASPRQDGEVRFLYAGGVYYGRDKTLSAVADAVRALRADGCAVRLDIYTSSPLSAKMAQSLDDGEGCSTHAAIPYEELTKTYRQSDVALHVESFQRKYALLTRLSFSTKIVDCLGSGCAVLAICPAMNAGLQYLQDEDAALCLTDPRGIAKAVERLSRDAALRQSYKQKAVACLRRNHNARQVRDGLLADIRQLAKEKEVEAQ